MLLFEITSKYNKTLNPKLWDDKELKPKVAEKLKAIADEFIEFLEVPDLEVTDIIITGSNANYNWTKLSDIDLHVVANVDAVRSDCPELADDFFQAKKHIWNTNHDISIYGHPVELYVQDKDEPHIATGIYSLQNDEWEKEPTYEEPTIDDTAVEKKAEQFKYEIDQIIDDKANQEAVSAIKERIRNLRQMGLQKHGEWSTGNLAFKELRNTGYLEKLYDYARSQQDKELSLEGNIKP